MTLFGDLFGPAGIVRRLVERLTFDRLMSLSDPKRITRSATVRVPPLKFDAYKDQEAYYFNVKSSPSTTGLRHKGYVRVFKPKTRNTPLERCECEVDCGCPDYKYRWAWANKQRGSSFVGTRSLNQAWDRAPRITNPTGRPGLCKHIIATRDYIYGQFRSFAADQERVTPAKPGAPPGPDDTVDKLDRLVAQMQKRWADHPGEVAKAKERDRKIRQSIERAAYLRANPSARLDTASPSARPAPQPTAKPSDLPPPKGSEIAGRAAGEAGDETVAAWRARRSEESLTLPVVRNMTDLEREMDFIIRVQEEMDANGNKGGKTTPDGAPDKVKLSGLERATVGERGRDPNDNESEELKMLREIRDIVRHLAGDDLPPDLVKTEEPEIDPGIPVEAAEARDQN